MKIILLTLLLCLHGLALASDQIRYFHYNNENNKGYDHPVELLQLALQKAGVNKQLVPVEMNVPTERIMQELESGKLIDIYAAVTSKEREARLLPIRISIEKGLMGWRIPLVKKDHAQLFKTIKNLDQLKKLVAGQGINWPDTTIFRQAGITVEGAWDHANLLKMLQADRFDYYPRSILDIEYEHDEYTNNGLMIDPNIAIHYPTAYYFFVNRENTQLAKQIQTGLELALKDGSFDRLFYKHFGAAIKRVGLSRRVVIDIPNEQLPDITPLHRKELWFHP